MNNPTELRAWTPNNCPNWLPNCANFALLAGQTGGHFGAGLGVVELTIALHYCYNTPDDRLVWDVGHQTYPHKILTGRREQMLTMRQAGGRTGSPKPQRK